MASPVPNAMEFPLDIRAWLNYNAMFYKTFICFYVSEAKPLFFSLCSQIFDDNEFIQTFKMFVTQMNNYLFVVSFELMFWKTLRCSLDTVENAKSKQTVDSHLIFTIKSSLFSPALQE